MNAAFRWLKSTRQSKYTIDEPHFSSWNLLTLTAMCLCTVRLVRHTVDMILRTDEISAGERNFHGQTLLVSLPISFRYFNRLKRNR